MSFLNRKSVAQKHLSSPGRKYLHLAGPITEPDCMGFSGDEVAITGPCAPITVLRSGVNTVSTVVPVDGASAASAVTTNAPRVTPHSVFLRKGCVLPDGIGLLEEPFCERWVIVQDMEAATLDRKIRAVGWHFMWLQDSASRRGLGRTDETAIRSALTQALAQVSERFNAAEVDSLQVAHYPGFRVARVTLQARHIQQRTSLDTVNEVTTMRSATL
jgi:hypothetical protein